MIINNCTQLTHILLSEICDGAHEASGRCSLVRLLNLFLRVLNFLSVVANSSHHWGELGNKLEALWNLSSDQ